MTVSRPAAVLYLRLSAVVDDSTSLVRQERDLRALAEREGWDVVAVLVDEGISGRKARAKAEEAVRMIRDDEADVLAVWKLDRFTRQGWDGLGDLSRALDARKVDAERGKGRPALFYALGDGLNSEQNSFRLIAGVLSEVARTEAETTAARARSAVEYRRTVVDRFTGGASVPFGYASVPAEDGVGRVLVPDVVEAPLVREVAGRILDGTEPLSAIVADLNRRGIPTSKSAARRAARKGEPTEGLDRGRWRASTVRALWTADTLLGRVVHRGDLVRDEAGLPRSVWPPLLDVETLERLRDRLGTAPKHAARRPAPRPRAVRRSRLLSGVAYCGRCDAKMYVTTSGGRPIYACGASWNGGECPGVKIGAEALDEFVVARFLAVAGSLTETVVEEVTTNGASAAALAEVESALREASSAMLDDDVDMVAISERIASLKAQRAALRAAPASTEIVTRETGRSLAAAFEEADSVDWRREILLQALDHVTIGPAYARGISPLDPSRVALRWRS